MLVATASVTDRAGIFRWVAVGRWSTLLLLVTLCYWPGLHGGFVFDDDVNILQNEALRLKSLDIQGLRAAAGSGHAGPLGRPVAMASFAIDYLIGGAQAYQYKLTNLLIHLCNTALVGMLAARLCQAFARRRARGFELTELPWAGWMVAALWGLHPLNLTGVLYVVQRMTSLSTLFGLAALVIYTRFREQTYEGRSQRPIVAGAVSALLVLSCLVLSIYSKESGLVFLALLLWVEIWAYQFRFSSEPMRIRTFDLRRSVYVLAGFAAAYLLLRVIPPMVSSGAYANRDFTLPERVMTEGRILIFYLRMFLLPRNAELSLYHDDFEISRSLWEPASTALALLALGALTVGSWLLRRRLPEFAFAWGWFLICHSLESTIFPLELAHEHRNYFAMIGFMLGVPLALHRVKEARTKRMFVLLFGGYLALLGFVTHVRATQWSNNVDWAALEAANHPHSPRANYELARVYMILMNQTGDSAFGEMAEESLTKATRAYLPGVLPFMARIQLAYFRGVEPDPALFDTVERMLKNTPFHATNTGLLNSMLVCQVEQKCKIPDQQAIGFLSAALANPTASSENRSEVLKLQAQYEINRMDDLPKGVELMRQSIAVRDKAPSRLMLAQGLAMQGKYSESLSELGRAATMDQHGVLRQRIERERLNVIAAQKLDKTSNAR